MSREGRAQPIQPSAWHGFVDPGPGPVGTVPPRTTVVPHDPRPRHFYATQQPAISISGALRSLLPSANPPTPIVADAGPRGRALNPVQPVVEHGFLGNVPPNGTTPPPPVNIDRADQRSRYRPLDPFDVNAALLAAASTAPVVLPKGPFVVPLDDRRRFLAALPPASIRGYDDVDPPQPFVVEPDDRRRRYRLPIDPTVLSGLAAILGPVVIPPAPQSVEPADRRRRITPDPLSISGALATFFGPFVAPPRPLVVISDERGRRVYPQPIVLAGPAFPSAVVAAIYTQQFGGPDPGAAMIGGQPDDGRLGGDPDDGQFVGAPSGNVFSPPKPGRA